MKQYINMHTMYGYIVQTKVSIKFKLTLHWQAIYCTWGLRMSSSTWHKSTIYHVCVMDKLLAELLTDTVGLLCNKHLALKIHTRKHIHLDKHTKKSLKTYFAQIPLLPPPFYSPPTSRDTILEFQVAN